MLSILIPTYNHNAFPLAKELERQALELNLIFELICIDDGSFSELNVENQKINSLTHCRFIEEKQNIGRTALRLKLAQMAQYDQLLLLDADVFPKRRDFLTTYLKQSASPPDVYFGGFSYDETQFSPEKSLRYKFGKHREQMPAVIRNKKPYKVIISGNFLISKQIYIRIMSEHIHKSYGMDYFFGSHLKAQNIEILHIDNEVNHNGIDTNKVFLDKTRKAVENLHRLVNTGLIKSHSISLLKTYKVLRFTGLCALLKLIFNRFHTFFEHNLLGHSPSLMIFDFYRLAYLCTLKSSK